MSKAKPRAFHRKVAEAAKTADRLGGAVTVGKLTADSFQNFAARVGIGTDNLSSASTYGFNPITRNRTLLEWMYRGSWVMGQAVNVVADDMTRAGIEINSDMQPDDLEKVYAEWNNKTITQALNECIKWDRLYGGSLGVLLIDGQKPDTPLRLETVGKGQFKGIMALDRWMADPSLSNLVTEYGPDLGLPKFYTVVAMAPAMQNQKIHYSRVIRLQGIDLPYWQRTSENLWGMSVAERLYDRLVAFDSSTQGAAQLMYKAHLRTISVESLREIISAGGPAMNGLVQMMNMIRGFQSNEGLTLIDAKDKFETHSYSFSGVADTLLQFGQQLSGALQIPLVRLFGQSPAGLNASGDSDLRTYYDGINQQQELKLRRGVEKVLKLTILSLGMEVPDNLSFTFKPLWQMTDKEKAEVAKLNSETALAAFNDGVTSQQTTLKELRQQSRQTGIFSNITDEDINQADVEPPAPPSEPMSPSMGSGSDPEPPVATASAAEARGNAEDARAIVDVGDLQVIIENAKGTKREGRGWTVCMPVDYGYIPRTHGADGENLDAYVGPNPNSRLVWIINQRRITTGAFDEHKCMLGFDSEAEATAAYLACFDASGPARIGSIKQMEMPAFIDWSFNGNMTVPA